MQQVAYWRNSTYELFSSLPFRYTTILNVLNMSRGEACDSTRHSSRLHKERKNGATVKRYVQHMILFHECNMHAILWKHMQAGFEACVATTNEREPWRQNRNDDTAMFQSRQLDEVPVPTSCERERVIHEWWDDLGYRFPCVAAWQKRDNMQLVWHLWNGQHRLSYNNAFGPRAWSQRLYLQSMQFRADGVIADVVEVVIHGSWRR